MGLNEFAYDADGCRNLVRSPRLKTEPCGCVGSDARAVNDFACEFAACSRSAYQPDSGHCRRSESCHERTKCTAENGVPIGRLSQAPQSNLKAVGDSARTLEREKVDLIYTVATSVSLAAKQATQSVPIVFFAGTNRVAVNLVQSMSRPGNRLTGVYSRATKVTRKRLELLHEIASNIRRVLTLYDPGNRAADESAKEGRESARALIAHKASPFPPSRASAFRKGGNKPCS